MCLPVGYSCPGAEECMTRVDQDLVKIIDGPNQRFRCSAAEAELNQEERSLRWLNYRLLVRAASAKRMAALIEHSLPKRASYMQVHDGGDYFNSEYFHAWCIVAENHPEMVIRSSTKSLEEVTPVIKDNGLPDNLKLTLSWGGKKDAFIDAVRSLAEEHGATVGDASVIFHPDKAGELPIAVDDEEALDASISFVKLLHSRQPDDTEAAEAVKLMKKEKAYESVKSSREQQRLSASGAIH